jgi:hypothetical protein
MWHVLEYSLTGEGWAVLLLVAEHVGWNWRGSPRGKTGWNQRWIGIELDVKLSGNGLRSRRIGCKEMNIDILSMNLPHD